MRTKTVYICDICETQHDVEADAMACEAQGRPEAPPWLTARVGCEAVGFGERGVVDHGGCKLRGLYVVRLNDRHVMCADTGLFVSHNQGDYLPAYALDPMRGYDFLRYVDGNELTVAVAKWVSWCREYGIDPDPTKASWWGWQEEKHDAILAAVEQAKERI